jgi:apolipoprotein N-acyltransferase
MRFVRSRSGRLGLAAFAGLLLGLAFPSPGWSWLGIPAVTLLTLVSRASRTRGAAALGVVFGLTSFGYTLYWGNVVGPDAWLGLTLLCTAWLPLITVTISLTAHLRFWPVWAATAWVLEEALRSRVPFGGFSWERLAFATPGTPLAHYAAVGGAPLATFTVALCGTLLAAGVLGLATGRAIHAALALVGVAAVIVAGGLISLPVNGETIGGNPSAVIALVQGDVAKPGLDFLGRPEQVLRNHVSETVRLAADIAAGKEPQPQLIIWPENASDLDPDQNATAADLITTAARAINRPILVGAVVEVPGDPQHVLNVGIVWDPVHGNIGQYAKRHLVPFGEYVPFRSELTRLITRFNRVPRDFQPGDRPGLLNVGGVRLGDVICFEIAYDDVPSAVVRAGARLLVVQTNNATYGRTSQPAQQLQITRLRAIEHGRTIAIAATSGITAIIAPNGSLLQELPTFVPDSAVRSVVLRDSLTLSDRLSVWPEIILCLAALAAVAVGWRAKRLRSSRNGSSGDWQAGATT